MQLKCLDKPELTRRLSICSISVLLLFWGFISNYWHVAEQQWFLNYQHDTESLVVGRIVKSRQNGIFSSGGLTGVGARTSHNVHKYWLSKEQIQDQYSAYLDGLSFDEYSPYMSQIGGQGMLFSLLDSLITLSPQTKLRSFYMFTALLSAIALTLVILWFYCEFGLCVAVFVSLSMVLSQWLTVFGRNLWWSIWAFYLPMIAIMYFLRYSNHAKHHFVKFGFIVFTSVLVKCLLNGYEYITTTLVMMIVPFVYYSILNRLRVRQFFKGTFVAVCSSCVAILLSLVILCFQISSVKGSVLDGFEHIVDSFGKRSHGEAQDYSGALSKSLESSTIIVVLKYMKGTFFNINNYLTTSNSFVRRFLFKIRYFYLIVLFLAMTILLFYRWGDIISAKQRQKNIALIFTTWFSSLAPLSWYVIFKAHSHIHTHMNFITWQMPFTFFGFAVLGLVAKSAFSDLIQLTKRFT